MKNIKLYLIIAALSLVGCSEYTDMSYTSTQFKGFSNTCVTNSRIVNVVQVGDTKTFSLTCKVRQ